MKTIKEHKELVLDESVDLDGLESYLQAVWQNRHTLFDEQEIDAELPKQQQFLDFLRGTKIKSGQYVGFLQYKELNLCIYPKLFPELNGDTITLFYQHLVYWLSYCRRINFPFNHVVAELAHITEFPEALIHYFAKRTLHLLQQAPYHQFELLEETLPQVKGRLMTQRYINESMIKGHYQRLICEHEPMLFDNTLNSIIKYVARKLMQGSRFKDTWHYLEQIIFLLDEVEDKPVTAADCERVKLNPLFTDYRECLDMCRFFLNNDQIQSLHGRNDQFCFLLPMNYVFEDFLCGFIEDKFKNTFKTVYQHGDWLTDQRVFRLKSDLVLKDDNGELLLIIDTKYKLRQREADENRGISQADLYQMLAYAVRQNCRQILLLYPSMYGHNEQPQIDSFTISSVLLNGSVRILAADLQICSSATRELDQIVFEQLNDLLKRVLH